MQFSKFNRLLLSQSQLDFVDVNPVRDKRLFLDPYAIGIRKDAWSSLCADHIRTFFEEVIKALRTNKEYRASHLMSHLHEPRDTFLGLSRGIPKGRGVGRKQAIQLLSALRSSSAVKSGLLRDLGEAELFLPGIGPDKISDLTTNVLRGPLIDYTKSQCELHGVKTRLISAGSPIWNPSDLIWESTAYSLPVVSGQPVLLVPKYSVRSRLSLDSQEFYNHQMTEFLRAEYLEAGQGLVHTLKTTGEPHVYKKDVKARHPFSKDALASFVQDHPEVLETYKRIQGARGPLEHDDFERHFNESAFAQALAIELRNIKPGKVDAPRFETFVKGVLSFLFYPDLIMPIKSYPINDGRKVIDISFTNAASDGFFNRMLMYNQTRAASVIFECKNYSDDPGNPEVDQILGRFDPRRGYFGVLVCRKVTAPSTLLRRCRDAARSERGFVISFDDKDLTDFLSLVENRKRDAIVIALSARFDQLQR